MVTDISRLSRDVSILKVLERSGVSIISIEDAGKVVSKKRLRELIKAAEADGARIAKRAKEAMQKAKARGVLFGNRKNLSEAARRGSINNVVRADLKSKELADFLQNYPGWKELKHGDLVDLLNTSGPLNLVKASLPERKKWTYSSLRKPLLKAVEELAMRADLEAEDVAGRDFVENPSHGGLDNFGLARTSPDENELRLSEDFKSDPRFGAF